MLFSKDTLANDCDPTRNPPLSQHLTKTSNIFLISLNGKIDFFYNHY